MEQIKEGFLFGLGFFAVYSVYMVLSAVFSFAWSSILLNFVVGLSGGR